MTTPNRPGGSSNNSANSAASASARPGSPRQTGQHFGRPQGACHQPTPPTFLTFHSYADGIFGLRGHRRRPLPAARHHREAARPPANTTPHPQGQPSPTYSSGRGPCCPGHCQLTTCPTWPANPPATPNCARRTLSAPLPRISKPRPAPRRYHFRPTAVTGLLPAGRLIWN